VVVDEYRGWESVVEEIIVEDIPAVREGGERG